MANETTASKTTAGETAGAERTRGGLCFRPHVDIQERGDELLVLADVPGAKPDDIDIRFEEGTLAIHATVQPRQSESVRYLVHEYGVGDYYRTFQISEAIDASKISAECADGVLTLHLPKAESAKPRKISVKAQ